MAADTLLALQAALLMQLWFLIAIQRQHRLLILDTLMPLHLGRKLLR